MVHPSAALLVVSRFRVAAQERDDFLASADEAMAVLAGQPGCRTIGLGQSTDEPDLLVIRSEWEGIGAYRRALSSFEVKVRAVPLLSRSLEEPSAFELVRDRNESGVTSAASGLAADAGVVGLGSAAAPRVPPVST